MQKNAISQKLSTEKMEKLPTPNQVQKRPVRKRRWYWLIPVGIVCLGILALCIVYPDWYEEAIAFVSQKLSDIQGQGTPADHGNNLPNGTDKPSTPPVTAEAKGWFGETMPQGMSQTRMRGEYLWKQDKSIMVYIPEGPFWRGEDSLGRDSEKPMKQVFLSAYYIDRYEVTNEQYWKFLENTGYQGSGYVTKPNFNELRQPIVGISWQNAADYARWAQKRLPTEAEWEKASRGGVHIPNWQDTSLPLRLMPNPLAKRRYPWGNEPVTPVRANYNINQDGYVFTAPVELFKEGCSPYTCHNMVGNVQEWCQDSYDPQ
jgi:hypothetical protein